MTDDWRVDAGAGGSEWGCSARDPEDVVRTPHRHPSELQARLCYVANTGAAWRAGQGSICGRRGYLSRKLLEPGSFRLCLVPHQGPTRVSKDVLHPDYLQTLRNTKNRFLIHKIYIRNVSPLKSLNSENKELS